MTEAEAQSFSVGRTSLRASAGTLCSAVLGFARNLVLAAAIGTGLVADSYYVANQVPNQIFLLVGGGTLANVFVPQLMRHARTSAARSNDYGSFLLFAGAAFGLVLAVLLLILSPMVIRVIGGSSWSDAQFALGVRFSLWCIPQIFFLALFNTASQMLTARGHFSVVSWVPSASSLVVILGCIPIIIVGAIDANSPQSVGAWSTAILGGATLLGSAVQALLLIAFLRPAGFRLRFRFQVRGLGLRATAVTGLLTILAGVCYQSARLVSTAVATQAGSTASDLGFPGRGYTALFYAEALLLLVQSVASASLASVILQRLSNHYAEGNDEEASRELSGALIAVGAVLIPVTFLLVCLGPLAAQVLFARGETDRFAAHFIGLVLAVMAFGLVPSALHDVLIRPFYALHDARTPLRSAVIIGVVRSGGAIVVSLAFSPEFAVLALAAVFGLAYALDLPFKLYSLRRRVGFAVPSSVMRGYLVAAASGVIAATCAGFVAAALSKAFSEGWFQEVIVLLASGVAFFAIYHPLTSRSAISLGRFIKWLQT